MRSYENNQAIGIPDEEMEYAAEADIPRYRRVERLLIEAWAKQHSHKYQGKIEIVQDVAVGVPPKQGKADAGVVVVGVLVDDQRDKGDRSKEREEQHEHDI